MQNSGYSSKILFSRARCTVGLIIQTSWYTSLNLLNVPPNLLDRNLIPGFLIIVIPFTLWEVNRRKWCRGVCSLSFPFALLYQLAYVIIPWTQGHSEGKETHISFKIHKLQPATIHIENHLVAAFIIGFVDARACCYCGRVCFLVVIFLVSRHSVQFLAKEKEIPDSFCISTRSSHPRDYQGSHVVPVYSNFSINFFNKSSSGWLDTYKPRKTNPIRMHLSTRRTLYLEGIVIRILFCILRTEIGDSIVAFVSFLSVWLGDCGGSKIGHWGACRSVVPEDLEEKKRSLPGEFCREEEWQHCVSL